MEKWMLLFFYTIYYIKIKKENFKLGTKIKKYIQ